jgi:hypothetical protein
MSIRAASLAVLIAFSLSIVEASAQQNVPPAPAQEPAAPAPAVAPVFPPPDPANFTASAPTKETVNAFLQASWGYDDTRVWAVEAIQKTSVEGLSKVLLYVGDKTGKQKPGVVQFFALPDGKHIIAGEEVLPFGDHPYTEYRTQAQQRADGPSNARTAKMRKPTWRSSL